MRRTPILLLAPLMLALACQRPEVEAFRQHPGPVSVSVSLPAGLADREGFQKEYASALRARLATRVVVVPEGVQPPVGAVELQVDIRDVSPAPGQPSPTTVGVAVGATVGALSAASGNRGWSVVDGLFWGLWAGSNAAMAQEHTRDRLGYRPQVVRAQVRLVQPGNPEPLWTDAIEPSEVVEAMDPLPPGSRDDDGRIREEEAKGFARVVVQKLSSEFHWMRLAEQRFYQEPAAKRDEPPPAKPDPEPKKD
ncbi:hypothetical protein [Geothrix fuzhouensis]|uniref:hypothetical protein n=1 Tax=Geothrix fuzhouensis TaxID=2966451 RepID=UPI0021492FE0|nr:hypothetical protein [Geothrix fuzhouensis]